MVPGTAGQLLAVLFTLAALLAFLAGVVGFAYEVVADATVRPSSSAD